jgi:hypothetical protein
MANTILKPAVLTKKGKPLYEVGPIITVFGERSISRHLALARSMIEGTHETGMEKFVDSMKRVGYKPSKPGPGTLPMDIHLRTIGLASEYISLHESRLDDDLNAVNSLQATFPDLLYAVRRHHTHDYLADTIEKVVGFEGQTAYHGVVRSAVPVIEEPQNVRDKRVTVCDVRQFSPVLQATLQPYLHAIAG